MKVWYGGEGVTVPSHFWSQNAYFGAFSDPSGEHTIGQKN